MSSVFADVSPQKSNVNPLVKEMLRQRKKLYKEKLKEKRARLIVRNLPFSTTEDNLREYYEQYGNVVSVDLLKKPDGKLVGCAFIQFRQVQNAAKARHHTNGKEFIGRTIHCDFAVSKQKYDEKILAEHEIKQEPIIKTEDEIKQEQAEIKEEPVDEYESSNIEQSEDVAVEDIKSEDEVAIGIKEEDSKENMEVDAEESDHKDEGMLSDGETKPPDENMHPSDDETKPPDEDDEKSSDQEESDDDADEPKSELKPQNFDFEVSRKPRQISNDVAEGKTVFIKNVPFDATNEDLRECMSQFGPLYYALICIDKLTEHSKGTGFVKFKSAEDAEKCLQAGTELTLMGNILDCHKALDKNELQAKHNAEKNMRQRDSRNLYLVKEGVVLAGTKAAEGVSAADMAKRLQLEQYKTQILRNLNMFVSRNRLIVHNLPPSWDDTKLRTLFKNHAGAGAIIKEARIMRNMKDVDSKGVGKSKEYGFVSFTQHEHALRALRSLNNNPNIFTPNKRPIVAFSIENKSMVKAKEKRLLSSRLKNPTSKMFDPEQIEPKKRKTEIEAEAEEFSGTTAKPGVMKMRSRYNLKTQAKLHYENLKKLKKKVKYEKKKTLQQKKQDFIRQPGQKMNKKPKARLDDNFSKMVSSYKKTLLTGEAAKKSKWYEG